MKTLIVALLIPLFVLSCPLRAQMSVTNMFAQTASVTVANTTTESTVLGTGVGLITLPASFLTPGRLVIISVRGYMSTMALLPGTFTCRVKLGGTTIGTATVSSLLGAMGNQMFLLSYNMTCRTSGVSGTVIGQGDFRYEGVGSQLFNSGMISTSPTTIDTTQALALNVTVQWGTANVANTVTLTNVYIHAGN